MAGCSAAIWSARLDLRPDWVEAAPAVGGQLGRIAGAIPDYPGLPARSGAAFLERLEAHLAALGLRPRLGCRVTALPAGSVPALVCTGVLPRRLGLPGEDELRGIWLSARRDGAAAVGRDAVVVGGGDGAVENALILVAAGAGSVTLVHRRGALRARPGLQRRLAEEAPGVRLVLGAEVAALRGDADGALAAVTLSTGEDLPARALFLKLGYAPASEVVADRVERDPDGYVLVDAHQRTSDPAIYAAGDVCSPRAPSLATAAGQGMVAVKAIADSLRRA